MLCLLHYSYWHWWHKDNVNNIGGFYKCALSDFEIIFEGKLKVVEGFCPPGNVSVPRETGEPKGV